MNTLLIWRIGVWYADEKERAAFLTVDRRQRRAAAAVEKAKGPTRRRLAADLVAVEADWLGTRAA